MKAIINDVEILNHLQPQQIDKYLKSKGWHEQSVIPISQNRTTANFRNCRNGFEI
ncbi:hypothetical protein PN478_00810 [Dolichospermum circinale CS-534/05]|jgi:hypothetical protein|uniref:hypothetical protein n=1 Tax=Dolichospermum TaxID=748770 RepID=UPI0014436226|nr:MULTISPECIES: hypothetical protein [Dolichospermum]MCW9681833.1 hypothetical protein [Dolichospermum planctonicum UHCC 0167]MDB9453066.1 hypothetical protein [Dolichospermum circinale CS-541/06]MDB9463049.1 hypothetical protein [Dolichospermum circinale CS-541/04]MDB9489072.1 hypothetical protein [Dolichospermum circinale CS-534/05]MDB9546128.1 hypothetical protein [Dolichospermum circinale CS-1031]